MSTTNITASEAIERDRQDRLAELNAEEGSGWVDRYKAGSFGCHELLDRTALVAELIESRLLSHPSSALDPEWYALAERAASALHGLYQRVGSEHV